MAENDVAASSSEESIRLQFHYLKSSLYRTVHVDGAFGGRTPGGLISMQLFSERFPIPTSMVYSVSPEGLLGEEVGREVRSGIVRELEFSAVFNVDTARALRDWLSRQIEAVENQISTAK